MSDTKEREGLSVRAMVVGVMILVTFLCWAIAASSYFGALFDVEAPEPGMGRLGGRGRGLALIIATVVSFVLNSLRLNHAPAIIMHTLTDARWIVVMYLVLMGCVVVFGLWVKKLEVELAGPKRTRKGKRRKKRRPDD